MALKTSAGAELPRTDSQVAPFSWEQRYTTLIPSFLHHHFIAYDCLNSVEPYKQYVSSNLSLHTRLQK